MKHPLQQLLHTTLAGLHEGGALPVPPPERIHVERTRDPAHGDFASNVALTLAKQARKSPRELAALIAAALPASELVAKVEIAGPGFVNFHMAPNAFGAVVNEILTLGEAYGCSRVGAEQKVQVEFVSANPTGPLHVGHGRGAAYGACVANLLQAVGFAVQREYYVNDAGRQMDILALSVWLRYLELCGEQPALPAGAYQGDYVWDIAAALHRNRGAALQHPVTALTLGLESATEEEAEARLDALIARAKNLLGPQHYEEVFRQGLDTILADIRDDLAEFGVHYDHWFSERTLTQGGAVQQALARLRASGHVYEREGALWFRSTDYGDEKDRVVVRENGEPTYFASDIAYHMDKLERGFTRVIDIWGADHHGYVPRVKAALAAVGDDPSRLDVLLVQFAVLYRGGHKVQMSTRSGEFVTLRELRKEVGNDAARFFYVLRKCEQHMDFDLDLAKSESNDNPVYYIQYAHARICSVFRQLEEKGWARDQARGLEHLHRLSEAHERNQLNRLSRYPEVIEEAALAHEPHQVAHYLRELAQDFHTYYTTHQFLVEDGALRDARLNLVAATRQVLANGLGLLGVSAPEVM